MKATIEVTDTFGGEANYAWCQRHSIDADGLTDRQVVRRLKKLAGLNGVRSTLVWGHDTDERRYNVVGACVTFFISIVEE